MLMPSHAKNVISYEEPEPLFTRFQIERQLNAMFSPYVTLRSGGYLVINQTEALVAIDVNSGKATREFSIEETAHNTNLEASDEIARQLKLRDLAGLIVVDFIDMEEKRNNRQVERRLKEALRFDRARIQVGRISHFGLLEMSRQRLRTGVLEGSTSQCQHCQGTGIIRSTESVALAVLRGLEDAITAGARTPLVATTTPSVALYILNNKRAFINDMEARHGLPISIAGSDKLAGANFSIERGATPAVPQRRNERVAVNMEWGFEGEEDGEDGETKEVSTSHSPASHSHASHSHAEARPANDDRGGDDANRRGGKRRRRRRGGRRDERPEGEGVEPRAAGQRSFDAGADDGDGDRNGNGDGNVESVHDDHDDGDGEERPQEQRAGEGETRGPRNRRRGRRGGRRGRERQARNGEGGSAPGTGQQPDLGEARSTPDAMHSAHEGSRSAPESTHASHEGGRSAPEATRSSHEPAFDRGEGTGSNNRGRRPPRERTPTPDREAAAAAPEMRAAPEARRVEPERAAAEPEAPKRSRRQEIPSEPRLERVVVGEARQAEAEPSAGEGAGPTRKGWWQRRLGSE